MKNLSLFLGLASVIFLLTSCSKIVENSLENEEKSAYQVARYQDTGDGTLKLISTNIDINDDEIKFMTDGIDEDKTTFVYVANQKVFEQEIKNSQTYSFSIQNVKDAHRTDYEPKVQLVQYSTDNENGDITTFKQQRYSVEK